MTDVSTPVSSPPAYTLIYYRLPDRTCKHGVMHTRARMQARTFHREGERVLVSVDVCTIYRLLHKTRLLVESLESAVEEDERNCLLRSLVYTTEQHICLFLVWFWFNVCVCVCVLSLIHISEPTRHVQISYAVFCL